MDENYFDYLPDEMVTMIFSYLAHRDIKSVRETCQRFEILADHIFKSSSVIIYDISGGLELQDFIAEWVETNMKCKNMSFKDVNFNEISYEDFEMIFSHNLCEIEELEFLHCTVEEAWLVKILERMPRIKSLRAKLWQINNKPINYERIISAVINRVEYLHVDDIPCLDRETMESIPLDVEPKLKELYLPMITYDFVEDGQFKSTGCYFILKLVAKSLKIFRIYYQTYTDLLSTLYELNMNLEEIELCVDDGVYSDAEFEKFIVSQTNLRIFTLKGDGITDKRLKFICEKLIQLRRLELHDNDVITAEGVKYVTLLPELIHFRVCRLTNFWDADITDMIAKEKNCRLKTLDLRGGKIGNDTFIATVNNLKQLSRLSLVMSLYFLSELIPLIYENLPELIELRLHRNLDKIHWRGWKGHDHIKQNLQPPLLQSKDPSISLLKRLKHLSLSGFSELSGAYLEDIAKLKDLKTLQLKCRSDLSFKGFKAILENCYYIKSINIQRCNNFITNDTEKTELAANFPSNRFSFKVNGINIK